MASGRLEQVLPYVWRGLGTLGGGRPKVAVLGGVHGNELAGLEAVRRIVGRMSGQAPQGSSQLPSVQRGELILAEANPKACEQNVRFVDIDLNRCFDMDLNGLPEKPLYEQRRASELAPHLEDLDVLVDLHGTNKPSVPFIRLPGPVDQGYLERCEDIFLQHLPENCRTVLWDPRQEIAAGAMTDEFAHRNAFSKQKGVYICYEAGLASDVALIDSTEKAVEAMLLSTNLEQAKKTAKRREWTQYEVFETLRLDDRGFEWMNGHGGESFGKVPKGETLGRRKTDGSEIRCAAEEVYIVFPKVKHLWGLGRPLGWLARKLPPIE